MPAKKRSAAQSSAMTDLPRLAQQTLGWDPRITVYVTEEKKIKEIREDKLFTPQHAEFTKDHIISGFILREIGALAHETTRMNRRIVQVTASPVVAISEN